MFILIYLILIEILSILIVGGLSYTLGIYIYIIIYSYKISNKFSFTYWKSYYTFISCLFLILWIILIKMIIYAYENFYYFSLSIKIIGYELIATLVITLSVLVYQKIKAFKSRRALKYMS